MLLLRTARIKPGPPVQQGSALSIIPLTLGFKNRRCQHATQLSWRQNLNCWGQSEFTNFYHVVNFFEIGHIVALNNVDGNGHGGDEDQLSQKGAELTAERNDVGALSFLVSIRTDDGLTQHGWVVAVEVGVDGNVTENLYSHEEDANSKNDSHYESTVPVAGYAFFMIK